MWKIIVLVILLAIALAFFIGRPSISTDATVGRDEYGRKQTERQRVSLAKYGWVPAILAILFLVLNSFTQIHAKEIGVGVSFGKPVSEYNAGVHLKPFWQSVTKIDETVFVDTYDKLPVRLGDGNTATANTTLRWHVNPAAVDYIYASYRSNDPAKNLRDAVVDTQYGAVVNNVAGQFNPTSVVQDLDLSDPAVATRKLNFVPDYNQMASDIADQMKNAVKDADGVPLIIIDGVTVAGIAYSDTTEKNISGLVQQAAKTQQAFLLKGTNQILAQANNKLKASLSGQDAPAILAQQCFRDMADGKITPVAGFSCWPTTGGSIVVPSAK